MKHNTYFLDLTWSQGFLLTEVHGFHQTTSEGDFAKVLLFLDKTHHNQRLTGLLSVLEMSRAVIQVVILPTSEKRICSLSLPTDHWKNPKRKLFAQNEILKQQLETYQGAQNKILMQQLETVSRVLRQALSTVLHCHSPTSFRSDHPVAYWWPVERTLSHK